MTVNVIGGAALAAATASGLAFVLAGGGHASHCGPCLSGKCKPELAPATPTTPVPAALPAWVRQIPPPVPFRSAARYDEPPLAPVTDAAVIPAGFQTPALGGPKLLSKDDPF